MLRMTQETAPGPATMKDVAELAGVSVPTVSRYISASARVSPSKGQAIAQAIKQLRFVPNAAARALMGQAAKVVAVVAGDTSKFGYAEALRGIEEAARLDGYLITITVVDG
jgi:DNA-binding LacI/PurR family transcriptional regulator